MEPTGAGAPAIPLEEICERLSHNCLSPRFARTLREDPNFAQLQYRAHQIFYVFVWARDELDIPISIGGLERSFNCSHATVQRALKSGWDAPKPRGRHAALPAEAESEILDWIRRNYEKSDPVTRTEIRHHCETEFTVPAGRGWVDSFILRHRGDLIEKKSNPQEESRLQIPRLFLDETIRAMKEAVEGRPSDLVFNLDEVGVSEWEDRKAKKVVVPSTAATQTIHHRLSRNVKHLSIITCISASGGCLVPYIVSSQATGPVQQKLTDTGLRLGRDLIMTQRAKAYINGAIFANYIRGVFLPHLLRVRIQENLLDEDAVLLMDNCPAHVKDEVLGLLNQARVRIVTFAPHTTHLFQILDLALFGMFKRRGQYHLPFENDHGTAAFIQKVYHDFRATMIDTNIRAAFTHIGLSFVLVGGIMRLRFDEIILRETPGFQELWTIDFPLEKLSARRQRTPFGWINKPE
jgi:transposase